MKAEYKDNWYEFEELCDATELSVRATRALVATLPESLVRDQPHGRGRPRHLYHYSAHPRLAVLHAERHEHAPAATRGESVVTEMTNSAPGITNKQTNPISPDDLLMARFRLRAVRHYEHLRGSMREAEAAASTVAEFLKRPLVDKVTITDRLPGGHRRKRKREVTLSQFSPASLRRWYCTYMQYKADGLDVVLSHLAPGRKRAAGGASGRRRAEIPRELLDFVWALSGATARADVTKGVEHARQKWPGKFPEVSIATWQRRMREMDPRQAGKDLNHSVSRFRQKHSPDIERDYTALGFNAEWQIDDVQKDWYGFSSDWQRTLRPYCYVIRRVRTRQVLSVVSAEEPITQVQVQEQIGFAFASMSCGLPDRMRFERGAVACTTTFEELLNDLGVAVSRTSMDGGKVHPGAAADRATGHFQGKPIAEGGFRRGHAIEWEMRAQVGPNQRDTAPMRTETIRKLAAEMQARGEPPILPSAAQWHAINLAFAEADNNRPHTGLPRILDPSTGKARHMSPNEVAIQLADEEIRVMSETLLPMFATRAEVVTVTRNGIRVNTHSYGRFDDDLKALRTVHAYASTVCPDVCYVQELGRCLSRYRKIRPGDNNDQFHRKRTDEKTFRNRYEAAVAGAIEADPNGILFVDSTRLTGNPTPDRPVRVVAPEAIAARAGGLARGIADHRDQRAKHLRRFELPESSDADSLGSPPSTHTPGNEPGAVPGRRKSILDTSERANRLLDRSIATPTPEVSPWTV